MGKQINSASVLRSTDARQSPRHRVPLAAQIAVGADRSLSGRVRNISASGVLIQGTDTTPEVGTAVEFILRCHGEGRVVELKIPATVVRVEPGGIALRFGRYSSAVYTDLIEVIYNADHIQ